ncbi:hypothetical protein [Halomonas koreensis]|uniref:Uncharacterized protein n=1 Tax=Halomonas koreensis TaxID=245385 RepID=A0ABU1FXC6_9GAMM|nr:hypothetical protein [Halomonas koreensis]MDR5865284.1 hypothetical protein [Halomonas koreensis]
MIALLIIPILVCGIIWISGHPRQRLHISKYQGWLVYLHAAKYGSFIIGSVFLLTEFLPYAAFWLLNKLTCIYLPVYNLSLSELISDLLFSGFLSGLSIDNKGELTLRLLSFSATSIVLTAFITWTQKKLNYTNLSKVIMELYYENSQIDYLLSCITDDFLSSRDLPLEERKLAFITLDTRKFYIGVPVIISPPDEIGISGSEIAILPVYSGYRAEETLRMNIKNAYTFKLPDNGRDEVDDCDLIAIPKENIVSVSAFTMKIHRQIDNNMDDSSYLEASNYTGTEQLDSEVYEQPDPNTPQD